MSEDYHRFFEEEEIFEVINRYRDMLENKCFCFFDLYEFEDIIDYYIEQDNHARALEAIKVATKHYPFASSIKLKHAKVLEEKGLISKSLQFLEEIEGIESYNYEFHLIKGNSLLKIGKQSEAVNEFDKTIKLALENRDDIVYLIAQSFLHLDKVSIAIKYLLLAYEINENNLLVLYELAACFNRIEYWDKSIEYYNKFLETDPFSENVWFNLGVTYSKVEKFQQAIESLDFALAINPCFKSAYFYKAELLAELDYFDDAIKVYKELLATDNGNIRALCCIGECYEKIGKTNLAIGYFKKAKKIDNTYSEPWYGMATVYRNQKKYHHCLINIRKAIKLDSKNPEYWFFMGEVFNEMLMPEDALKAYTKTIELDPSDYEAWLAYSNIYFEENKIEDAIEILNKAYQYNYDISTINYQLANYHSHAHHFSIATAYFEKGLALNFSEHRDFLDKIQEHFHSDIISCILKKYRNQE